MHPWQRFDYQKYLSQYITSELTFPSILIGIGFITLAGTQHFYLWPSLIFMTYLCLKLTVQVLSYLFTLKYLNSILLYGIPLCLILFFISALMIEVQGFQNMQTLLFSIPGQIITISLLLASYYKFEPQLTHRWQNLEPAMLVRS
jgi:hypothetical protein